MFTQSKQPKVTSSNAKSIAQSKSANTAESKTWDSRYVADVAVDVRDDDNVSLTFYTPKRVMTHNGDEFAPDIASAIGDKSMAIFNRRGSTMMSFQRQGKSSKGEVEEPSANVETGGELYTFHLTGEEMKAAFTYINAKRSHTYSRSYNSATFASHVLKSAGISVKASSAKSFTAAMDDEIEREEKKQMTIYSYVETTDQYKNVPKEQRPLTYQQGYESTTINGKKGRKFGYGANGFGYNGLSVQLVNEGIVDQQHESLGTLYHKFKSSATLHALLEKFRATNSDSDSTAVFQYLIKYRHNGLDINDVNECTGYFENNSALSNKLDLIRKLYKIRSNYKEGDYRYPSILTSTALGATVYLKSLKEVYDYISIIYQVLGKQECNKFIAKMLNRWANDLVRILKVNPMNDKVFVRERNFSNLFSIINSAIARFFNQIPYSIIKSSNRSEVIESFRIIRTDLEKSFGKYKNSEYGTEYERMKSIISGEEFTGSENYINKLYYEDNAESNGDDIRMLYEEDTASMLLARSKRLAKASEQTSHPTMSLTEYTNLKSNELVQSIWDSFDSTKFSPFACKPDVPTAYPMLPQNIKEFFSVVQEIEIIVPELTTIIKNTVNSNIKEMDPVLLQAAGLGDLVPQTEAQGEATQA